MSQLIYVETSIPSFYYETRTSVQLQARREWTQEWWKLARWRDALVISPVVTAELEETSDPAKQTQMLALVADLPRLAYTEEIDAIVEAYFAHRLMPLESGGDAHHLALASFHRCDILTTWNCKHLANGSKTGHIHLVNSALGLHTPQLITPARTPRNPAMNLDPATPRDDGLEWLRELRRRMFQQADGDLKKLGDRYRRSQSEHPQKTFDPR